MTEENEKSEAIEEREETEETEEIEETEEPEEPEGIEETKEAKKSEEIEGTEESEEIEGTEEPEETEEIEEPEEPEETEGTEEREEAEGTEEREEPEEAEETEEPEETEETEEIEEDEEELYVELDYEEYQKTCAQIRETNEQLLDLFEKDLAGLAPKTIRRHLNNVNFYINSFLLYGIPRTFDCGVTAVGEFLGDFFIRKCMWSAPGTIKSTAGSIKKFYKCMMEHGKISKEDYEFLCEEIRDGLPVWQDICAQYNDPDEDNPFMFF